MQSNSKKSKTKIILACLLLLALVFGAVSGNLLARFVSGRAPFSAPVASSVAQTQGTASQPDTSQSTTAQNSGDYLSEIDLSAVTPRDYAAMPLPDEMRAMWVSFLEFERMDLSTEALAREAFTQVFSECAQLGLNTVILHVRPMGDALYESTLFPYSHFLTGTQGQDPGYDPLALMIEAAHSLGLRFEAWINPYRVQHAVAGPETLSENSPAVMHPEWAREVSGYMWLDPGLPEVRQFLAQGIVEIVQNYDVDGIHFDDYFYPEFLGDDAADTAFDADSYAQYGGNMGLAEWRRDNINRMMSQSYAAVKAANPSVSFGVSVQGNNENNYATMYADVQHWMSTDGYTDYVMPQLYWGFGHETQSGRTDYAFDNISATWASFVRSENVRLYAGLATYRIGMLQADGTRTDFGGNGYGDNSEWESGETMAQQVSHLRGVPGFSGFALFRHDYLFQQDDPVSESEQSALSAVLTNS